MKKHNLTFWQRLELIPLRATNKFFCMTHNELILLVTWLYVCFLICSITLLCMIVRYDLDESRI